MAFSDFWRSMAAVRDSQQQKDLFGLDRDARGAYGSALMDPGLFGGGQPQGFGGPPGTTAMPGAGGPPGQGGAPMQPPQGGQMSPFQRPQFGYGQGGQTSRFDQALYSPVANTMSRYAAEGVNSIGGIAQRWAQENGSDPMAFTQFLSRAVGAQPDSPLSMQQRVAVAKAIAQFENGAKSDRAPSNGMQPPGPTPGMMAPGGPPQGFAGQAEQAGSGGGMMQGGVTGVPMSGQRVGQSTTQFTTPGFSNGGPPAGAGPGGAVEGSPLPAAPPVNGAPPPQQGMPPQQGGGLDMNRILSAVQRANPNVRPEVIGEVVKRFLPILQGERAQGNADRSFGAGRDDERYNREVTERAYSTGREDVEYNRNQPVPVQTGVDYVDPKTNEIVRSGREKAGYGANGKPDAGTMKAIREADDAATAGDDAVKNLTEALALNKRALSGPIAGPAGYVRSQFGDPRGQATQNYSNLVATQAIRSLKTLFGGNPTEGERKVLLDELTASVNKDPKTRQEILERAIRFIQNDTKYRRDKAEEMRKGTYYRPQGGGAAPTAGGEGWQDVDGVRIRAR